MVGTQNFSLRTLAEKPPSFFRRVFGCLKLLVSLATLCPHNNRHWVLAGHKQVCWECGRVRLYEPLSRTFGYWYKEVR